MAGKGDRNAVPQCPSLILLIHGFATVFSLTAGMFMHLIYGGLAKAAGIRRYHPWKHVTVPHGNNSGGTKIWRGINCLGGTSKQFKIGIPAPADVVGPAIDKFVKRKATTISPTEI